MTIASILDTLDTLSTCSRMPADGRRILSDEASTLRACVQGLASGRRTRRDVDTAYCEARRVIALWRPMMAPVGGAS